MNYSDYLDEEGRSGWGYKEDLEAWTYRMRQLRAELRRPQADSIRENLCVEFPKYGERKAERPVSRSTRPSSQERNEQPDDLGRDYSN